MFTCTINDVPQNKGESAPSLDPSTANNNLHILDLCETEISSMLSVAIYNIFMKNVVKIVGNSKKISFWDNHTRHEIFQKCPWFQKVATNINLYHEEEVPTSSWIGYPFVRVDDDHYLMILLVSFCQRLTIASRTLHCWDSPWSESSRLYHEQLAFDMWKQVRVAAWPIIINAFYWLFPLSHFLHTNLIDYFWVLTTFYNVELIFPLAAWLKSSI
jgi:hypothetical protein